MYTRRIYCKRQHLFDKCKSLGRSFNNGDQNPSDRALFSGSIMHVFA